MSVEEESTRIKNANLVINMKLKLTKLTRITVHQNKIENPLTLCLDFITRYKSINGFKFPLMVKCYRAAKLNEEQKKWCFDLVESNMKKIYNRSKSGWNENEKREEMFEEKAYYMIAYDQSKPVGFCHFRFDMDYGSEVVYCYELQVQPQRQKYGLGNFFMQCLEQMCEKLELEKVILTCSKYNTIGQKFFTEKMSYEIDETDPNEENPKVDYVILSKVFWEQD